MRSTTMHSYTDLNRLAALEVLAFNKKTPETFIHTLPQNTQHLIMKDKDDMAWTFIIRRRCHLYILAKSPMMSRYTEIYKRM
jgi:hypothetical protein